MSYDLKPEQISQHTKLTCSMNSFDVCLSILSCWTECEVCGSSTVYDSVWTLGSCKTPWGKSYYTTSPVYLLHWINRLVSQTTHKDHMKRICTTVSFM
jgi:hypothetical protein